MHIILCMRLRSPKPGTSKSANEFRLYFVIHVVNSNNIIIEYIFKSRQWFTFVTRILPYQKAKTILQNYCMYYWKYSHRKRLHLALYTYIYAYLFLWGIIIYIYYIMLIYFLPWSDYDRRLDYDCKIINKEFPKKRTLFVEDFDRHNNTILINSRY